MSLLQEKRNKNLHIACDWRGTALLLGVALVMQLPSVIFGFELTDSGFYMNMYDNMFAHPDSVQYWFMYYLSGVTGSCFSTLTGGSILAIRILGLVCNLLALWVIWKLFGGEGRLLPFILATIVVTAWKWEYPLAFHHDILTMLLAVFALVLIVRAMDRPGDAKSYWLLFASGVLTGMNAFSRLTNFAELAFILAIPLFALAGMSRGKIVRRSFQFLIGWIAGVAAVILFAYCFGHLQYIQMAYDDCQKVFLSGHASLHSRRILINTYCSIWHRIAYMTQKLAFASLALLMLWYIWRRLVKGRVLKVVVGLLAILMAGELVYAQYLNISRQPITLLYVVGIMGSILAAVYWKGLEARMPGAGRRIGMAGICSLFMVLVLPLGSDGGVYSPGPIVLWMAIPVTFCAMWVGKPGRWGAGLITILLLIPCVMSLAEGRFYGDHHPLREFTAQVENPKTRGILTSKQNAERMDTLLTSLEKHVSEGDTLMVFDGAPMINHLTGTVPAIGCCWPAQFSPKLLESRLETWPKPRYVMMMKFQGMSTAWPEGSEEFMMGVQINPDGSKDDDYIYHNVRKSAVMWEYLRENGYDLVEDTPDFALYTLKQKP